MCCYCDYVLQCAAMWQSVAICDDVLLCVAVDYVLLCAAMWRCVAIVTMCYYAWLYVSTCENVLHVTVFLCMITCCDFLLYVTICSYCDYVLLCVAMWQSVAICNYVLLCVAIVTMCYYALLCDNLLLFVTMFCYVWLSVSMCENVLHVSVFLCLIICCELLLWVTICCYCDYALLCDNVLLFVFMRHCVLQLWLCVTMRCYVTISSYLWLCVAMCDNQFLCVRMFCMWLCFHVW
jgi:hypothetical protein